MITLKIIKYEIDKNTFESILHFELINNKNNNLKDYALKYPTNPILDIEIIQSQNLSNDELKRKINNIIKKREYSYKTIESLKKFIIWIESFDIVNSTN